MTREELLQTAKPILFNTDMVRAILNERKVATRRICKDANEYTVPDIDFYDAPRRTYAVHNYADKEYVQKLSIAERTCPICPNDILYVRETWKRIWKVNDFDQIIEGTGQYYYKAEGLTPFTYYVDPTTGRYEDVPWKPSIHMPKAAARIFLKVKDVRVERLQDMTLYDFLYEGVVIRPEAFNDPENAYQQAKKAFKEIWDATIKKTDIDRYGWDANPWVWAIEFERIETDD